MSQPKSRDKLYRPSVFVHDGKVFEVPTGPTATPARCGLEEAFDTGLESPGTCCCR